MTIKELAAIARTFGFTDTNQDAFGDFDQPAFGMVRDNEITRDFDTLVIQNGPEGSAATQICNAEGEVYFFTEEEFVSRKGRIQSDDKED